MTQRTKWLALGVVATVALGVTGAPGPYAQPIGPTVGEFVTTLANQGPGSPMSSEQALQLMRQRGLGPVVAAPNAPLTEASLGKILANYGFISTTQNPRGIVDFSRASGALTLFSTSILSVSFLGPSGYPAAHDAQVPLSDSDAQTCLSQSNPGQCVSCCIQHHAPGPSCARFCSFLVPSPSAP